MHAGCCPHSSLHLTTALVSWAKDGDVFQVKAAELTKPVRVPTPLTCIAVRDGRWNGFVQQFPIAAAELLRQAPVLL